MTAIILAGGKGTQLKPFTVTIPKALLPVCDVPIVEIVIEQLVSAGFKRIVLCFGHMAPLFGAVLGDGSRWGIQIEAVFEDEPLGTAGALRLVKSPGNTFLVMNGDLLTTIDFAEFSRFHQANKAIASIAVNRRSVSIDYGVVASDRANRLSRYTEKSKIDYAVSMGIYMFSRKALSFLPNHGRFDIPDLMSTLQQKTDGVFCYKTDCYWQDIGRSDDYEAATEDFSKDPARFLPSRKHA
jgi:NDP-sugar pyrophosphorylase family protein